jgi:hypothetical protein
MRRRGESLLRRPALLLQQKNPAVRVLGLGGKARRLTYQDPRQNSRPRLFKISNSVIVHFALFGLKRSRCS